MNKIEIEIECFLTLKNTREIRNLEGYIAQLEYLKQLEKNSENIIKRNEILIFLAVCIAEYCDGKFIIDNNEFSWKHEEDVANEILQLPDEALLDIGKKMIGLTEEESKKLEQPSENCFEVKAKLKSVG